MMKFTVTWSTPKQYTEGNFKTDFSGVYLIGYRDTETGKRYPIYVGQGDIADRLADHYDNNRCISKRINQGGRVGYYRYARFDNEEDRLDIELALYNKHGGKEKLCNEIDPPGSGRYRSVEVEETFQ